MFEMNHLRVNKSAFMQVDLNLPAFLPPSTMFKGKKENHQALSSAIQVTAQGTSE